MASCARLGIFLDVYFATIILSKTEHLVLPTELVPCLVELYNVQLTFMKFCSIAPADVVMHVNVYSPAVAS